MAKLIKLRKSSARLVQLAQHSVKLSSYDLTPEATPALSPSLSEYMSAMGRKGGRIGGKRRMKTMTAEERRKIAQRAAKARWKKTK
jgi:hypothetical protein